MPEKMQRLTTHDLIRLAEMLASDLIDVGRNNRIAPRDLLMAIAMASRSLQLALCASDYDAIRQILQEADATYEAATTDLEGN